MMRLMAIDPGLKGGIAIFNQPGTLNATWRMPSDKLQYGGRGKKHQLIRLAWLQQLIADYEIDTIALEVPSARPAQSSVGTATAFTNWGLLLALRSTATVHFVYPAMWKKYFGLGKDKQAAIRHAKDLLGLPITDKTTDGEAEAALIGRYWLKGGSERERAYAEWQKSRPKRRKRKAAAPRQGQRPAPALRKRRVGPALPAPTAD